MNRVVITGPTGAIGMALTAYLSDRNIQVLAVVRGDSARKDRIKESNNVAIVECALGEMDELPQRVRKVIQQKHWDEKQSIDVFSILHGTAHLEIAGMICICKTGM